MKLFRAAGALLSIIVFVYICCIGIKNVFRYNGLKQHYAALKIETTKSEQFNQKLKHNLAAMENPSYWELDAKQRLGYVYKHEEMIKVIVKD